MADGDGDEGVYDPMKDPARRPRRSNDPGWNYGYWLKPPDVNIVVCNLCGKITKGGIKRHKEHLAATGGDATGCKENVVQVVTDNGANYKAAGKLLMARFAKRIVSLCASSSGCERNWSTFEFIHTKKRNRLQVQRLNDNVFVSYNRKNMARFKKRREKMGDKSYDPLIIEDFDWGNEWVDPTIPPAQCARGCPNDISWELVDEAVGASSSLQGRNFPRASTMARGASNVNVQYQRQRKRAAPSPTFLDEDEEEDDQEQHSSIPNVEDDSDFPQDDVDVTDDEEDPTSADQDGEDNTNAIMDEFDDGY